MFLIDIIAIALSVASTAIAGFSIYYSNVMHKQDLTHENYEDIKNWYEKTLHIMKELYVEHAENYAKENKKDLYKDLVTLSQLIDSGRLYFPNIQTGENNNKPEVFRGRKPLIIDLLVLYYDIFTHNKQKEAGNLEILRSIQRAFTSEIITYLKENKASKESVEYTKYDKNGILSIANIDNQELRNKLNKDDIVTEILKANEQDLSEQIKLGNKNTTTLKPLTTLKVKEKENKTNKIKSFFGKKDKKHKQSIEEDKEI